MRLFLPTIVLATASLTVAADKKAVHPKEFTGVRPYSPGILLDGTLYVAGQVGNDLKTGQRPEEFEAEVRICLENIGLVLKEAKMDYADVVAVQVYLTDMDMFQRMNAVYTTYFSKEPKPTRTTVGVARLVGTARIEITVTARKSN